MKIAISIPVHEKIKVIRDQIENIQKYIQCPVIVLHVSASFGDMQKLEKELSVYQEVYINPEHLKTGWADIIHTHLSNFRFLSAQTEFDYFMMHSSNDMYVRKNIERYLCRYEAGFQIRKVTRSNRHWWPGHAALRDPDLKVLMAGCGQTMVIASQVEGSFYRYELMKEIVERIGRYYERKEEEEKYTREEVYFSTVASSLVKWENCGKPTTYSEVHMFDRILWKIQDAGRRMHRHVRWIIPQKVYDLFEVKCNDLLFKSRFYRIRIGTVKKIVNQDQKCIDKNRYLDDGSGMFQLYDGTAVFSVKRVEREYHNKVRKYIRSL